MATIENLASPADLLRHLQGMDEAELTAQQISQQGAIHALTFLLTNGCSEDLAIRMLCELRRNQVVIGDVAEAKGFPKLFADVPPNFN